GPRNKKLSQFIKEVRDRRESDQAASGRERVLWRAARRSTGLVWRFLGRRVPGPGVLSRLGQNHRLGEIRRDVAAQQITAARPGLSVVGLKRPIGEHLYRLVTGRARLTLDLKDVVSAAIERLRRSFLGKYLREVRGYFRVLDALERVLGRTDAGDRTKCAFVGFELPDRNAAIESHHRLGMRRVTLMVRDHFGAEELGYGRACEHIAGTPVADRDVGDGRRQRFTFVGVGRIVEIGVVAGAP